MRKRTSSQGVERFWSKILAAQSQGRRLGMPICTHPQRWEDSANREFSNESFPWCCQRKLPLQKVKRVQKLESALCWDRKVMYHCFSNKFSSPWIGVCLSRSLSVAPFDELSNFLFLTKTIVFWGRDREDTIPNPQTNLMEGDQRRCFFLSFSQMRCILWGNKGW